MPKIDINQKKPIIISIGGSLIVPNGDPDKKFLKKLKKLMEDEVNNGRRFVLVAGGGKTCRNYIAAASEVCDLEPEDLDWLGIHATRLNAHLLRTVLFDVAHPIVIKDPTKTPTRWNGKVLIGSGWKPGWSTDYVACRMAEVLGSDIVINASNISHVYDSDPHMNPRAEKHEMMAWEDYREMVGEEWRPGMSAPFDPIASKFCNENHIQVAIVDGNKVGNLKKVIEGKRFTGTLLH